ncbi:hypothetical protein HKD37_20G055956 [Glycine soja]
MEKHVEDKAKALADRGQWASFIDVLALLVIGVVLFPNVDGLVNLAGIDTFAYDTFDQRCEKSCTRIVCCTPALYVWLVSHLFHHEGRPVYPLQGASVNWFPRWKEGGARVLFSCEGFSNIPLMGTRGCINYNPILAIRQLGYPMIRAPSEESIMPFITCGFSDPNAWIAVQRKDKELRGSSNGIIGSYHNWLKARTQEITWLSKLKISSKEEAETPEESEEVQALKAELERVQAVKEKFKATTIKTSTWPRMKHWNGKHKRPKRKNGAKTSSEELCGATTTSSCFEGPRVTIRESKACQRSKRSLFEHLSRMDENMWAIIDQYNEKISLASTHEQRLEDEYAKVSVLQAEREARERVIDSLHKEAMMRMDRFTFTLNGSQELPRLLVKAKAMVDVYSAPEEVHWLLDYC